MKVYVVIDHNSYTWDCPLLGVYYVGEKAVEAREAFLKKALLTDKEKRLKRDDFQIYEQEVL